MRRSEMHRRRPGTLSSPWTMIMTPMVRVDRPQLFCQTNSLLGAAPFPPAPSVRSVSVSNSISNILEKFCPRQWLVPPCAPHHHL